MLPQEEFDSRSAVPDGCKGEEHAGVYCVCCHRGVVGFRYKCLVCPDYDICARCVQEFHECINDKGRNSMQS